MALDSRDLYETFLSVFNIYANKIGTRLSPPTSSLLMDLLRNNVNISSYRGPGMLFQQWEVDLFKNFFPTRNLNWLLYVSESQLSMLKKLEEQRENRRAMQDATQRATSDAQNESYLAQNVQPANQASQNPDAWLNAASSVSNQIRQMNGPSDEQMRYIADFLERANSARVPEIEKIKVEAVEPWADVPRRIEV